MTKKAKYILLGASGLVIIGGAFIVLAIVVIVGVGLAAVSAETESKPAKSQRARGATTIPAQLAGKWERSEGTSQIDYTGKTQFGGGATYTYEFSADNTVEFAMEKKLLTILQCEITETKATRGVVSTDGDVLTIDFDRMKHTSTSSCEKKDNFARITPPETARLKWRMNDEAETPQLCIEEENGEMCYHRAE